MKIRVGIEGGRKPVLEKARQIGAPILVSANSLWDNERKTFSGFACYKPFDTALDSGGFVAMMKYGGYRWTIEQYVRLAQDMSPSWWAQMDFCCEPEIASDRSTVWKRIDRTAEHLNECQRIAKRNGTPAPMPVLQGWEPRDYCAGPIFNPGYPWPDLVGIGSVCRRNVTGNDGVVAVVSALNKCVPAHVRFHLFGVKSEAIEALLADFPHRIASMDSMAWNMAARFEAYRNKTKCDGAARAAAMSKWYLNQQSRMAKPKQISLFQVTDNPRPGTLPA